IIVPNKYRKSFENIFNWLDKRPCARKRGLGTQLQFDRNWIIESLSDSTIYMSFYTIAHHIKYYRIQPEQLIPEFFDYVFLGKSNPSNLSKKTDINIEWLETMRNEFLYWYPVDHRHTAIMHISNHLSFFIFHHVAIFPEKYWPKIVTLIEPVIVAGQKMGKSKGNIIPLAQIQTKYSADLFRFYISHTADFGVKVDWRENEVQSVKNHIIRFYNFISKNFEKIKNKNKDNKEIKSKFAQFILSSCTKKFINAENALKEFNLRKYLQISFYEIFNILQDFQKTHSSENEIIEVYRILFPSWIQILSPAIPHICEELWELFGNKKFISNTPWKPFNDQYVYEELEQEYLLIKDLLNDIINIKNAIKKEVLDKIFLYTAPKWKFDVQKIIISKKGVFKEILTECKKDLSLIQNKQLVNFIKWEINNRNWEKKYQLFDEIEILNEYKNYLEKKLDTTIIINSKFDPENKASKAIPNKPAIYIQT
ncbi:MAG: class I tRNA ligase family protein, partial [Promethearchaeota archaeon]